MSTTSDTQTGTPAHDPTAKAESKFELWDMLLKTITLLTAIVGGFWQYFEDRRRDYEFTLYKERKEMYYPLCRTAAEIVSSPTLADAKPAIKTFETLYYGEVNIVADEDVTSAIKDFADALLEFKNGPDDGIPSPVLIGRSGDLAMKCKRILDLQRVFGVALKAPNTQR
jgi:hypothetical protein